MQDELSVVEKIISRQVSRTNVKIEKADKRGVLFVYCKIYHQRDYHHAENKSTLYREQYNILTRMMK